MYNPFRIGRVYTNMKDKKIILQATHDVLVEDINNRNIRIYESSSGTYLELDFEVRGKYIEVILPDFPIPNTEYVVIASNIKNVVDDKLDVAFKKSIYFKSEITSEVEILTPSNHEKVKDALIVWKEIEKNPKKEKVNKYYLEIATDPAFYNIVLKTTIEDKTEYLLSELKHRQYYIRIRVQDKDQYGKFSKTVTFKTDTIEEESPSVVDIDDFVNDFSKEEDDGPLFFEPLTITKVPQDGITPDRIIIEFNKDIDPSVADKIKLYGRDL